MRASRKPLPNSGRIRAGSWVVQQAVSWPRTASIPSSASSSSTSMSSSPSSSSAASSSSPPNGSSRPPSSSSSSVASSSSVTDVSSDASSSPSSPVGGGIEIASVVQATKKSSDRVERIKARPAQPSSIGLSVSPSSSSKSQA